jgi:dolichyl-phosphate-mannose--protein O-mannosyl transferase
MPALIYGELLAARTFEQLVPRRWLGLGVRVYLSIVVLTFLFFSPWIYAMPLTNDGHERRRWLARWN